MERISKDVKDQILARIREGNDSIVNIAKQHGVRVNTVYGWLKKRMEAGNPILEISRLKKENTRLKEIIGKIMYELERGKKD